MDRTVQTVSFRSATRVGRRIPDGGRPPHGARTPARRQRPMVGAGDGGRRRRDHGGRGDARDRRVLARRRPGVARSGPGWARAVPGALDGHHRRGRPEHRDVARHPLDPMDYAARAAGASPLGFAPIAEICVAVPVALATGLDPASVVAWTVAGAYAPVPLVRLLYERLVTIPRVGRRFGRLVSERFASRIDRQGRNVPGTKRTPRLALRTGSGERRWRAPGARVGRGGAGRKGAHPLEKMVTGAGSVHFMLDAIGGPWWHRGNEA